MAATSSLQTLLHHLLWQDKTDEPDSPCLTISDNLSDDTSLASMSPLTSFKHAGRVNSKPKHAQASLPISVNYDQQQSILFKPNIPPEIREMIYQELFLHNHAPTFDCPECKGTANCPGAGSIFLPDIFYGGTGGNGGTGGMVDTARIMKCYRRLDTFAWPRAGPRGMYYYDDRTTEGFCEVMHERDKADAAANGHDWTSPRVAAAAEKASMDLFEKYLGPERSWRATGALFTCRRIYDEARHIHNRLKTCWIGAPHIPTTLDMQLQSAFLGHRSHRGITSLDDCGIVNLKLEFNFSYGTVYPHCSRFQDFYKAARRQTLRGGRTNVQNLTIEITMEQPTDPLNFAQLFCGLLLLKTIKNCTVIIRRPASYIDIDRVNHLRSALVCAALASTNHDAQLALAEFIAWEQSVLEIDGRTFPCPYLFCVTGYTPRPEPLRQVLSGPRYWERPQWWPNYAFLLPPPDKMEEYTTKAMNRVSLRKCELSMQLARS